MNAPIKKPEDVDFGLWDHRSQLREYIVDRLSELRAYVDASILFAQIADDKGLEHAARGIHASTGPVYENVRDLLALNKREGV